ncbi:MAG: methionine adenosyltransferase [Ruminococcaceae bacterium]|nr:methionine adenosyltransferase [Oscillospiraceae bacterium]
MKRLFTSESVTEGHPDKLCDRVSDSVLDAILSQDKDARVACETFATTGIVSVMGEITTSAEYNIQDIVRKAVREIGYDRAEFGFDCNTCAVLSSIHAQSPDIALGVDRSGAGDQGMMFGYACDETPELMPLTISLAHKLAKRLTDVRKSGEMNELRPDGKTQVTIEYDSEGNPKRVDTVVVSSQHDENADMDKLRADIIEKVVKFIIPSDLLDSDTKYFINPTGRFCIGGPMGDTGLTGRKIIVDTYGGCARHGGGCFSGKDPTKVDRSAAYAARYLAKNVVKAGLAKKCEIQLSYAIGIAQPVSVFTETFGTGKIKDELISEKLMSLVDLSPAGIIERFGLKAPIYTPLSSYGHMGREDLGVLWEKTDLNI